MVFIGSGGAINGVINGALNEALINEIIVCLSILLLASLYGNIQQFIVNSRMTDNDLKYCYIKSANGISPENLYKLEDIFHFNPDEKLIREIRQNVENWEKTIQNTAEKVEHEKLRNFKSKK